MFIHLLALYGILLLAMGVLGNEAELVVLGLVMLFVGNMHRVAKAISKSRRVNF
ncbi:MAG: hypothetical protein ABWK05_07985 [Pyrobaculum sp.]